MKHILITGGAGFIGSNLCKFLLKDPENIIFCIDNLITGNKDNLLDIIDNENFFFSNFDISSSNTLDHLNYVKIDEIYHLACIASPPKYKKYSIETLMTSFIGTKNMLDLAKIYKCKLLFSSTSEVYRDPLVNPQSEEYFENVNTVGERSCYDEGKRVAESLIYEYKRLFNLDIKIVRIFNTYGPFMDINDGRVITNFIKSIQKDKPVLIYGDGTQTRSFCYIDDLIDGIYQLMNSTCNDVINIGNPYCEFTINELVNVFENILQKKIKVIYVDLTENDPRQRKPNIQRAKKLLGWNPKISLNEGLKKTIEYFFLKI
jgi:UDP-glucuronate decarboxylase